jgi:hypothetical protein
VIYFVLLIAEIAVLFLLSKSMSKNLSKFLSINLMSVIFLPGVIVHELSHLLIATILFVPVGNMEFMLKKEGDRLKLGSVEIAKTDPVRRCLIGFAPVLIGLVSIVGAVYLFSSNISLFQHNNIYIFITVILVLIYLLFAISNTMFASSRDMEGTAELLITLLIIIILAHILGFRIPPVSLGKIFTKEFIEVIGNSVSFLLVPIAIDVVLLGIIKVFKRK